MPETKNDFMLLAVHTDKEFTTWLHRHAEDGWWLTENRGNVFVFKNKPYDGSRICSYTVSSSVLGISAEDVFYEELDDLRKSGWQLLSMGMPENFTDKTRHAFLYEAPREDVPHPEIPLSDPAGQMKLLRAARKKAVSTLALCLLYAAVLIISLILRPVPLFTGSLGTVFLIVAGIAFLPCMYFSVRAASFYGKAVRDPDTDSSAEDFRFLDRAVLLSYGLLGILAAYLILDFFI